MSRQQSGFTLIEVLVAISLLAVISTLVWQAMGSSMISKERFEKKDEAYRSATLAMSRIAQDLRVAVIFSSMDFLGVSAGGEQLTKSVFIGKNLGDQDKITFSSLSHVRYLKDVKESDLAEVSYFLDRDESEGAIAGTYLLKKREASPPDADPEEGGTVTTLLEGVKELNFRFFDPKKTEYVDEWDSSKLDNLNTLPRAVEIFLVVTDPVDEDGVIRLSTRVLLEMSPGPNDF